MSDSGVLEVLNNYDVHIGVWTNWSKGAIRGATITTTSKNGALLIAFLALYVQLCGARFWRILCFIFHQYFSKNGINDGFYHQRQVVLRAGSTDYTSLFELLRISWAWSGKTRRPLARILPLCFVAAVHVALFTVAGIFSSYVTDTTGNEVLLNNINGGFLNVTLLYTDPSTAELDALIYAVPYSSELAQASSTYAQQCYNPNASSQACTSYVRPYIESVRSKIPCPFGTDICLSENGVRLDSGLIDSQFGFGINAPSEQRWKYRVVTSCAVLKTEGYSVDVPDLEFNLTQYPLQQLLYGIKQNPYAYGGDAAENYTLAFHTVLGRAGGAGVADYGLSVLGANAGEPDDTQWWVPRAELRSDNADSFIFFLSASNVAFVEPTDDPWYSAHIYLNATKFYFMDRPVSPLSCFAQYQVCNPNRAGDPDGGCTPLMGAVPLYEAVADRSFWDSDEQQNSAYLFEASLNLFFAVDISQMVTDLGSGALLAKNTLSSGTQGALPADQWEHEVQHWHDTLLASMQRLVVEQAAGPSDPAVAPFRQTVDQYNPVVSQPQLILNTSYTSFSILGMSIIIGLGTLIILISFTIEPLVAYLQRRSPQSSAAQHYRRYEWLSNQKFQLQRMAFEGAGSGRWSGALELVPTTLESGEQLPRLDLKDKSHPTLWQEGQELMHGRFGMGKANSFGSKLKGMFSRSDTSENADASSTANLRLDILKQAPSPLTPFRDDDTGYFGSAMMASGGVITPGGSTLETPASLLRHSSPPWRDRDMERERLVKEKENPRAYVDVTRTNNEDM